MTVAGATVFRRYVALELARLREAAGMKRGQVVEHLRCSEGHVRHLESARQLPNAAEVRTLLQLFGVGERTEGFLELVDAARRGRDWWADFPGVPQRLELLLGMEGAAAVVHGYDAMVPPGLFQTSAYAEEVMRAGEPHLSEGELRARVDLRMQRQDVLVRRLNPPAVWCLLEESVLYRRAAGPQVLVEQLNHLVTLTKLPNVHIQVLPFDSVGIHAGIDGTFEIFTFGPEMVGDPGVVYTETRAGVYYHENPADIQRYRDTWSLLQLQALDPEKSLAKLVHRVEEITT